jgi:cytochrome b subunit of formate dehydrogenase
MNNTYQINPEKKEEEEEEDFRCCDFLSFYVCENISCFIKLCSILITLFTYMVLVVITGIICFSKTNNLVLSIILSLIIPAISIAFAFFFCLACIYIFSTCSSIKKSCVDALQKYKNRNKNKIFGNQEEDRSSLL